MTRIATLRLNPLAWSLPRGCVTAGEFGRRDRRPVQRHAVMVIVLQGEDGPPNWILGAKAATNTQQDYGYARSCPGQSENFRARQELPASDDETKFAGEDENCAKQSPGYDGNRRSQWMAARSGFLQGSSNFRTLIFRA